MSIPDSYLVENSPAAAIVEELGRIARTEGPPQTTEWPGLTVYRSSSPIGSQWDEAGSLSICLVAQGRKRVTLEGVDYMYSPLDYLVFTRNQRMQVEILEASASTPVFGLRDPDRSRDRAESRRRRARTTNSLLLSESDPGVGRALAGRSKDA